MTAFSDYDLAQLKRESGLGLPYRSADVDTVIDELRELRVENRRLRSLINSPQVDDFIEAVRIEAAHQQERWPSDHDAGKSDPDWFWLIGYLAGKALRGDAKKLHHIITTAAVCLNWHRHATGESTRMRPGIEPPGEVSP